MSTNILVVDDEPGIREMLTAWLNGAGYRCAEASAANEALAMFDRQPADVALLDLALPQEDGLWLARQLRSRRPDTSLIMVTGLQRFDAAVEGMRLGVADYLLKPFSRQQLLASVRRAVERQDEVRRDREEAERLRRMVEDRGRELSLAFAELEVASAAALDALLVTLYQCDPASGAHARRVARMAVDLAHALGLKEPEITDIERGALLHDIGKIAMPDALMLKPGPLTPEEIAVIRTHARVGHEIVATVPALQGPAEIVLASHEAWDGSGYPRGLVGRQIPVGARIVAVVDTFDALTRGGVYRDPVSYARAAAELVRCAGVQFDPEVVHYWLRVAESYRSEGVAQ